MALPRQFCWQQQPGETPRAFHAFTLYRNMEPNERSLQRVASGLSKSVQLLKRWSSRWEWVDRVAEWDDYQEMRRLEHRIEEKQKMDERHLRMINAGMTKLVEAIQQADSTELARNFSLLITWLSELIRLERLIRGEPESIEERRKRLEVKSTIQEELRVYVPIFQELLDEGAITLDAVGIPQGFDSREGSVEGDDEEDEPIEFEE